MAGGNLNPLFTLIGLGIVGGTVGAVPKRRKREGSRLAARPFWNCSW
ncbi:LPXTG cell wall anchor domain-containing protein [Bradyrhizobium uaiense]|uniref:LPXTG cell wall anchor domain-containing protein n=1 Tax=Bradyrhizobium uaiense TaxID=2594946 RepID=A0A6P1BQF5_9BRAD|nr:LPXTG cell wall anchor domain-containing protein [Bradyrhizobium uaiense]